MFSPHITVACIIIFQDKYLFVEEEINGVMTLNQPAGHLEAGESLVSAMQRELWEETGISTEIKDFMNIYQWQAPDGTPFIRFNFTLQLAEQLPTQPHDSDIQSCLWLTREEYLNYIQQPNQAARSELVLKAMDDQQKSSKLPIDFIHFFS